mmetsp:Transcript_135/g.352  ORF Transcript_135/g.352 Transcript_135/m.352 type:complete len:304 (-) Transcript_135:505-1416(-)
MVVTDLILAVPAIILALATVPFGFVTLVSAVGIVVVPLIVVDTIPEVVTNSMTAFGARFGVSILKILEDIVTIVRLASVVPVISPVTTGRMPRWNLVVALSTHKFVRPARLFSVVLLLLGFSFIKVVDALGVIDALLICAVIRRGGWASAWALTTKVLAASGSGIAIIVAASVAISTSLFLRTSTFPSFLGETPPILEAWNNTIALALCVTFVYAGLAIGESRFTLQKGGLLQVLVDAISKGCTIMTRRFELITMVPSVVGDMLRFVLGNATIVVLAVTFLVLPELITARAPRGRTILVIAVV